MQSPPSPTQSPSPPEGFGPHRRRSPVTDPWQPIYARETADAILLGVHVRDAHCNARGFAHGGVISSLADNALGLSAVAAARRSADAGNGGDDRSTGVGVAPASAGAGADESQIEARRRGGGAAPTSAVTVSLSLDFIDSARIGDWLEIRPTVLKAGRTLVFTEGRVVAIRDGAELLVARCSATFRLT